MIAWTQTALATLLAFSGLGYILGIVNPAHYLVRLRRGCDIRELGNGNAGATNAGRVLGRWGFVVVLILDGAKGAVPVCLARRVSDDPMLAIEFIRSRYDVALASGTVLQRRLYAHLGFVPFGPLVGSPDALFQPMSLRHAGRCSVLTAVAW